MSAQAKNIAQIIYHSGDGAGGNVTEWSERRIRNPEALGSSSALTTELFHGRPEFETSATPRL